jgi:hypothetical protein
MECSKMDFLKKFSSNLAGLSSSVTGALVPELRADSKMKNEK